MTTVMIDLAGKQAAALQETAAAAGILYSLGERTREATRIEDEIGEMIFSK